MSDNCVICNLPKSDHHQFRLDDRPVGCKCDISWWPKEIEEICNNYEEWQKYGCCSHCEHGRDCHKSLQEG